MSQTKPNAFSEMPENELPQDNQSADITPITVPQKTPIPPPRKDLMERRFYLRRVDSGSPWLILTAIGVMMIGLLTNWLWLGLSGTLVTLLLSLKIILPSVKEWVSTFLTDQERKTLIGFIAFGVAIAGLLKFLGVYALIGYWLKQIKWDEFGSWADWVGALGQIMIAVLAVYVAWEQYVISRDLTIQQNRITQQQTIDT